MWSSSTAQSPLAKMLDLPYPQQSRNKAARGRLLIVPVLLFSLAPAMVSSMTGTVDFELWLGAVGLLVPFFPILIAGIRLIMQHQRDLRMWRWQIGLWQQAIRVWITLRYCHRDHVVYQWPDVTILPTLVRQFTYDQNVRQPGLSGPQRA